MPKINTYTNNTSIEDNDKLLTYDTEAGATKLTLFSTIKDWMLARMAAVTSRTAGSSDDILTVNNGTVGKSTMSSVAKSMVEDYTGSSLGGSTRSVKAAIDATTTALSTLEQETDDAITDLRDDLKKQMLLADNVPNTIQSYTFTEGSVSRVEHSSGQETIRTDVFSYTGTSITETRTLNTGEALTILTNLLTLETTVTYTAA